MSKTLRFDIEALNFNPNDMGADHHSSDAERRALANRCVRVAGLVLDAHGMGDVDCDADRNEGDDAHDFGNEVFDAVCGETSDLHAAGIVLRTYGGPTARWFGVVARFLVPLTMYQTDTAFRAWANKNTDGSSSEFTDEHARVWSALYMVEYARVLGQEVARPSEDNAMSASHRDDLQGCANLLGVAAITDEVFKAYCGK